MTSLRLCAAPPCSSTLEQYAINARLPRPFNHGFFTGGFSSEDSLRVIRLSAQLGRGSGCYRRAKQHLLSWRMHDESDTTGIWRSEDGDALVTYAKMLLPRLYVLNPCRVIHIPPSSRRAATTVAYTTTRGHLIAGCELMTVSMAANGEVTFHVESRSRGAGLLGRLIFPVLAPAQHRFFSEQCRSMQALMR